MNTIIAPAKSVDYLVLIGRKIRLLRTKMHLTQEFLAFGLCDVSHLSKLENGKLQKEDLNLLITLANRLEIPFYEILKTVCLDVENNHSVL